MVHLSYISWQKHRKNLNVTESLISSLISQDFEAGRVFSSAEVSGCSLSNELLSAGKRDQLPEIRHNTLGKQLKVIHFIPIDRRTIHNVLEQKRSTVLTFGGIIHV